MPREKRVRVSMQVEKDWGIIKSDPKTGGLRKVNPVRGKQNNWEITINEMECWIRRSSNRETGALPIALLCNRATHYTSNYKNRRLTFICIN